jgi:hypothetical protein
LPPPSARPGRAPGRQRGAARLPPAAAPLRARATPPGRAPRAVRTAKFVARKQWVVCGADDMYVRVFNYNTMDKVKQFEAHTDYIRCAPRRDSNTAPDEPDGYGPAPLQVKQAAMLL